MDWTRQLQTEKLLALPNIHAGLNFIDDIFEYATIVNCYVLGGEMTHKIHKKRADKASPPNLAGYHFIQDCLAQSIRLGTTGAWFDNPGLQDVQDKIKRFHRSCPQLALSLTPAHELKRPVPGATLPNVVLEDDDHLRL